MTDNPTIQDVLRQFYPKYLEVYTPNGRQAKAAHHILNCKTGAYGAKYFQMWAVRTYPIP